MKERPPNMLPRNYPRLTVGTITVGRPKCIFSDVAPELVPIPIHPGAAGLWGGRRLDRCGGRGQDHRWSAVARHGALSLLRACNGGRAGGPGPSGRRRVVWRLVAGRRRGQRVVGSLFEIVWFGKRKGTGAALFSFVVLVDVLWNIMSDCTPITCVAV